MKTFIRLAASAAFFTLFTAGLATAQTLDVTETTTKTEDGKEVAAWQTSLDQDENFCRDTFDKFIKQTYGLRTTKLAKGIQAVEKAKMVDVSQLRGDLRAVFSPKAPGTNVAFTFSPGYDIHLSKAAFPEELAKLGNFAKKYTKFHYAQHFAQLSEDTQKKIRSLQSDLDRNGKRIVEAKSAIAENETKISAGDSKASKLMDRNKRDNERIATMENENIQYGADLRKLNDSLTQVQESLRKVNDY